jgi:hypothetical protein
LDRFERDMSVAASSVVVDLGEDGVREKVKKREWSVRMISRMMWSGYSNMKVLVIQRLDRKRLFHTRIKI